MVQLCRRLRWRGPLVLLWGNFFICCWIFLCCQHDRVDAWNVASLDSLQPMTMNRNDYHTIMRVSALPLVRLNKSYGFGKKAQQQLTGPTAMTSFTSTRRMKKLDSFSSCSPPSPPMQMSLLSIAPLLSIPAAAAAAAISIPVSLYCNQWYIWSILVASASLGLAAERTKTGAALSGPLTTMLITLVLCNLKLLPASSIAYDTINKVFVQIAVPLLLFDADMRRVIKYSGTLLSCFVVGSFGTILGTIVAYKFIPMGLGVEGWKVASALAARHIGGAVNFVAVAETFGMTSNAVVASLAADNLIVALYFIFLFWITKSNSTAAANAEASLEKKVTASDLTNEKFGLAIAVSMAICGLGEWIATRVFSGCISAIPIATLITVCAATCMPKQLGGELGIAGSQVGLLLMQLFFAATGACGDIGMVMSTAPLVLIFSAVQLIVHYLFLVSAGRLLRLPFRELILASNANVGGPTTAAGMAAAKGWKLLMLPALLTGILGYAAGTFIGVGLGQGFLQRMPIL